MEGPDGHVLRRESRAQHRHRHQVAEDHILHFAQRLHRSGAADGGRLPGDCHGGDSGRHRLPPHRPFRPVGADQLRHGGDHQFRGRLYQLFPRWCDRRRHRHAADAAVPRGVLFRPQARGAGGPKAALGSRGSRIMNRAMDWISVPLSYPFMQRALIVAVLVGAVCAVLSCYLVLKGWSLMGDAVSHAVLPGIVIAYAIGLPLALGAFVAGLACALFTGYLKENSRVKEDTVMGIVFSGMFGFGLVLFTKVETDQHLNHILFGNMLGVTVRDLVETGIIAGMTLLAVLAKRRDLLLYCFDANHARVIGLPVRVLHYGLLIFLSLTIVASLKAVGIILIIAMLVAPGAIAYLLTDRFERMLVIATAVAVGSSVFGTLASFHIDGATGACIVLTQACVFLLAFVLAPKRGLLAARRQRRAVSEGALP